MSRCTASVLAALAVLVVSGPAYAATITITASPDPVAGAPMNIQATGELDRTAYLYLVIRSAGACAPAHGQQRADPADQANFPPRYESANFSEGYTFDVPAPGDFTVCGYLSKTNYDDETDPSAELATASQGFTARLARTPSLAVNVGPIAQQGATGTATAFGSSEAAQSLSLFVAPYVDPPCAPSAQEEAAHTIIGQKDDPVQGDFSVALDFTAQYTGPYMACAYLGGNRVMASTAFDVAPPAPTHLSALRLSTTKHWGLTRRKPGKTTAVINVTAYAADVSVAVRRGRRILHRVRIPRRTDPSILHFGDDPLAPITILLQDTRRFTDTWRCDKGGRTTYEASATDAYGRTLRAIRTIRLPSCKRVLARARALRRQHTSGGGGGGGGGGTKHSARCSLGGVGIVQRNHVSCSDARAVLAAYFGGYLDPAWNCRDNAVADNAGDVAGICERVPNASFLFK